MDSTVAYQGAARGLGEELVERLNAIAVDGCIPDRTVLLTLGGATAAARGAERGGWGSDRFEREGESFHERIAAAFAALADAEPERIVTVDGSGATEEVHAAVLAALGAQPPGAVD
jgi:dTMP kinase